MAQLLQPLAPPNRPTPVDIDAHNSSVRLRIAPTRERAMFLAWAQEQLTPETPMSAEVQKLEGQLVAALCRRNPAQALTVASALVYTCPEHAVAKRIKARCAQSMRGATRVFPRLDSIPKMRLPWHELGERNLSRHAAFMLSCIDGRSTVEQLIDVSAMSPLAALDTLDLLVSDGIVELT